jgi:hypothetical protein
MNSDLNLDTDAADEARALHRVVRAMHDGHCPNCGFLDRADLFFRDVNMPTERHECPRCDFVVFYHESQAALARFRPYLQKSVRVFEEWRDRDKENKTRRQQVWQAIIKAMQFQPPMAGCQVPPPDAPKDDPFLLHLMKFIEMHKESNEPVGSLGRMITNKIQSELRYRERNR